MVSQSVPEFREVGVAVTNFNAAQTASREKLDSAMASPERSVKEKLAFSGWKYRHYFSVIDVKGKNVNVTC